MTDINHNGFDIALWYIGSEQYRPRVPDYMVLQRASALPRMGNLFWFLHFTYLGVDDQKHPAVFNTGYSCNVDMVLEHDTPDLNAYCPKISMNGALKSLITVDNYLKHHTDYDVAMLVALKQVITAIGSSWTLTYHCTNQHVLYQLMLYVDVESLVIFDLVVSSDVAHVGMEMV